MAPMRRVASTPVGLNSPGAASAETSGGDVDLSRPVDAKPRFRLNDPSEAYLLALWPDGQPARKTWDANQILSQSSNLFRLKSTQLPAMKDGKKRRTEYSKSAQDELFEEACAQLRLSPEASEQFSPSSPSAPPRAPGALSEEARTQLRRSPEASEQFPRFSPSRAGELPDLRSSPSAPGALSQARTRQGPEASSEQFSRSSPSVPPKAEKPQKRADKYFALLMKSYDKRTDGWAQADEEEARDKAEGAARWANRRAMLEEKRKAAKAASEAKKRRSGGTSSGSDSDSEDKEEKEEELDADALGKLVSYDGTMQVDLEIVLLNPPGVSEPSESGASSSASRASTRASERDRASRGSRSSKSSSKSSPRPDLYAELEALKEEMGVDDEAKSENSDDVPEGLRLKTIANVWDNPKPRWSLGLGGTVFFIPDAERYSFGGSMPPPPPPSLHGRHKLRLKPRLPLDISNNRYRDEHPNIWPDAPFSPELQDYARFEQKLLTLDFYRGCNKALTRLPQAKTRKDDTRHRTHFGRMVLDETRRSQAWKNFNHREMLRRKEEKRKALEEAEARAKAEEMAKLAALAAAAGV